MTATPSIVILGIGNTLMQDDGVGVCTVRAMADGYEFPSHVRLVDGGVGGLRLLSEIDGAEHLLIIDAVQGNGEPGTIYHLGPEDLSEGRGPFMSAHEIGICEVLSLAEFLEKLPHTRILGVQPLEARRVGLDLTLPLQDALPRIVGAIIGELRLLGVEPKRKRHSSMPI
jgi:hydrogenase maturation protease